MVINCSTILPAVSATTWQDMLFAIHVGSQIEPSLSMLLDEMDICRNLSRNVVTGVSQLRPNGGDFQAMPASSKGKEFWRLSSASEGGKTNMGIYRAEDAVLDANRRAYSCIVEKYSKVSYTLDGPTWRAKCREVFLKEFQGVDVLEIGAGPAFDSAYFAQQGFNVTATDYCKEFIKYVNIRHPHIRTHVMDFTRPDLPPQSFDGIYGLSCFVHVPHSLALSTLTALHNLLRTKGRLFLVLIESEQVSSYIIDNWYMDDNPVTFFCYAREEIQALLFKAGFKTVEIFDDQSTSHIKSTRLQERGVKVYQIIAKC